jgi:hypothetical protein
LSPGARINQEKEQEGAGQQQLDMIKRDKKDRTGKRKIIILQVDLDSCRYCCIGYLKSNERS